MNAPERLETDRLILRRYHEEDAFALFQCYAQDTRVTRYLTWKPHQSIEETKAFLRDRIQVWDQGDDFTWAILFNHQLIGGIGLRIRSWKADFGYVIGYQYQGHGYASEALRALIQWALLQPGIFRVGGVCDIENIASARVMEKCGLEKEGVLRKYIMHPQVSETPRDCWSYSITK